MSETLPTPGRFYACDSDPAYRYGRVRRFLDFVAGNAVFVEICTMEIRSVKAATFIKWVARELAPGEAIKPYAHVLTVGEQSIWHVYKYRFPMEFWYSLSASAVIAEPPGAIGDDQDHHFDVRDLPERYRAGLEIECMARSVGLPGLSPLDASRREHSAHIAAIGRALADGFDIRANQTEANERRERERATERGQWAALDEEIPF